MIMMNNVYGLVMVNVPRTEYLLDCQTMSETLRTLYNSDIRNGGYCLSNLVGRCWVGKPQASVLQELSK